MLHIQNLSVSFKDTSIIKDLSLSIAPGTVHALMGANGSGKSTLAHVLMGHPSYQITAGTITFNGVALCELSPDKRAQLGLFVAFQHPVALAGVRVQTFLQEAVRAVTKQPVDIKPFNEQLYEYCKLLSLDPMFLDRSVNEGFSGGEKKRLELLQLLVLKPQLVILDEIDSGLDIDGLSAVAQALAYARSEQPHMTVICITHYQRLLEYVMPDHVHVLSHGSVVTSGDMQIVRTLEARGYDAYR